MATTSLQLKLILLVSLYLSKALAFVTLPTTTFSQNVVTKLCNAAGENDQADQGNDERQTFLEETALSGADKIREMSIEERTKRAMLAEAVEDRMIMLEDKLIDLLDEETGMPKVEDREEVKILALEVKAARQQYQQLVSGEDCPTLNVCDGSTTVSDDKDAFQ